MRVRILVLSCIVVLTEACATTRTRLAPVSPEAIEAEEIAQRELVLRELNLAQQRLDDLSFALLTAAVPLCEGRTSPRFGMAFATAGSWDGEWSDAARDGLRLTDTVTVTSVAAGSPADRAGLREGDRVLKLGGTDIPHGDDGLTVASTLLERPDLDPLSVSVRRGGAPVDLMVQPVTACDFETSVVVEGGINAYADGERVILPWAMMRFADDEELRVILGHEIAHNAMGHLDAQRSNAILGGFFGAIFDVALATQGVNTGGQNTANFMSAGAQAFSQDFEREADYVGLYVLARAGVPLETAPDLWRNFAQIDPAAISFASSHPTTAERFVRLREVIAEIDAKRAAGEPLMPDMKPED